MTIEKIARDLGVSKSTVSRALAGKGRISEETRKKICDYAKESGYVQRAGKKRTSLALQGSEEEIIKKKELVKTGNIGVLLPKDAYVASIPFFQECLLGISEVASEQGYYVLLASDEDDNIKGVKKLVEQKKVDGIILLRGTKEKRVIRYLLEKGIKVGLTGICEFDEVIQVDTDNYESSKKMVSTLLDCGYRRMAMIVGEMSAFVNKQRVEGFFDAIDQWGIPRKMQMCVTGIHWLEPLEDIVRDMLTRKVDCVVCGDDVICGRMISVLQAEGYRIPLDISVASLYNSSSLDKVTPSVTAVNISPRRMGKLICTEFIHALKEESFCAKTSMDFDILMRRSAGRRHGR